MNWGKIKNILKLTFTGFKSYDGRIPDTYEQELARQSYLITLIASLIMSWAWLSYIPVDRSLHPDVPRSFISVSG
jgi:hypothetical protein